jgi:glycosyltransferase involved in cell wall biosynthesis
MPHINIIARTNGVGLDQDVDLLHGALKSAGFQVTISHCRGIPPWSALFPRKARFDANLFLERVFPRWVPLAHKNFLIPNQERFPHRHLKHLRKIDTVLCKTGHALDIFSQYANARHIGFTSTDRSLPELGVDYGSCFHLAGRSTLKSTETILELWAKHPSWPELTLIQCEENAPASVPDNVRLISRYLTSDELVREMNRHGIHLCTSRSEGWGHYIVEAMSCRSVVVTTDAPPMNELIRPETGILVPYDHQEPRHLGTNFYVAPERLAESLDQIFNMDETEKRCYGQNARAWFDSNHQTFACRFPETIQELLD